MSVARRHRAARRSFLLVVLAMLLALPAQASALGTAAGTPGAVTATTATSTTTLTLGASPVVHRPAEKASTLSGGAILAAVLAALVALACLVWGLFRWRALEPHWLLSLRHSIAEAGFRASATWAEFTDWLRLGH
jgi:sugar (pentulose or hexulose) kinase